MTVNWWPERRSKKHIPHLNFVPTLRIVSSPISHKIWDQTASLSGGNALIFIKVRSDRVQSPVIRAVMLFIVRSILGYWHLDSHIASIGWASFWDMPAAYSAQVWWILLSSEKLQDATHALDRNAPRNVKIYWFYTISIWVKLGGTQRIFIYLYDVDIYGNAHITTMASMIGTKHWQSFEPKCLMRLLANYAANGYFSFSGASHKYGGWFNKSWFDC